MRYETLGITARIFRGSVLVAALLLQSVPFFFLLVVFAYYFGITDPETLVTLPFFFFAAFFAVCWLSAWRSRRRAPWARAPEPSGRPVPPNPRPRRPVKQGTVLIKSREERYRDLVEYFKNNVR